MKNLSTQGFGLVELLIAAAMMTAVAYAALLIAWNAESVQQQAIQTQDQKSTSDTVASHLQRRLTSGDLRFYFLTGKTGFPLARTLLPLPCRTSSLSVVSPEVCNDLASLLYVDFNKPQTPALSAICALPEDPLTPGAYDVLVDTGNMTYGMSEYNPNTRTFHIDGKGQAVSGQIEFNEKHNYALLTPPHGILFKGSALIERYDLEYTDGAISNLPSECVQNLQPQSSNIVMGDLIRVRFFPQRFENFVESDHALNWSQIHQAVGGFPKRLMPVQIRVAGVESALGSVLTIHACDNALNCAQPLPISLDGIRKPKIYTRFHLRLYRDQELVPVDWYQISNVADGCTTLLNSDCKPLPSTLPYSVALQDPMAESLIRMQAHGFSMIKAESIKTLRFEYQLVHGGRDGFNIDFP